MSTATAAVIVAVYFRWLHVNETTVALTFLVGILLVAANWGLRHSIYLSILSAAAFNFFFLPPVLTFTIGDSRNWIALLAFLVTGIVASQLAERARREAKISRRRQREAERLYEFSQQMLVTGNVIDLLNVLPQMIAATFNLAGAAIYLREKRPGLPLQPELHGRHGGGAARRGVHARPSPGRGARCDAGSDPARNTSDRCGRHHRLTGLRLRRWTRSAVLRPLRSSAPARWRR